VRRPARKSSSVTPKRADLRRQIDAAAPGVLADVAQDVGQLERDAALLGQRQRGGVSKPKMWMVVSPTTEATW
jgi:hypothetical protein